MAGDVLVEVSSYSSNTSFTSRASPLPPLAIDESDAGAAGGGLLSDVRKQLEQCRVTMTRRGSVVGPTHLCMIAGVQLAWHSGGRLSSRLSGHAFLILIMFRTQTSMFVCGRRSSLAGETVEFGRTYYMDCIHVYITLHVIVWNEM